MAVYKARAYTKDTGQELDQRTYLSVNVYTAPDEVVYDPNAFNAPFSIGAGTLAVEHRPYLRHKYANRFCSFHELFYKGVYFQQNAVIINRTYCDLGFISSDFTGYVEIFSANGHKRTVEILELSSSTAGVSTADISVDDVFYPYEEKTLALLVSAVGDAVINISLFLKFYEDPTTYRISIQGIRTSLFFMADPNWADEIRVEHRFLTSVFRAHNMSETRKVLRHLPVRSMRATLVFHNKYLAGRFWSAIRGSVERISAVPWYPDKSTMTAASGASSVYCDTTYRRFQEGGYVFLVGGNPVAGTTYFEVVRILSVLPNELITFNPLENNYVSRDVVYPAFICRPSVEAPTATLWTDFKGFIDMQADEVYGENTLLLENEGYTPTIREGLPVLMATVTFTESPEQLIKIGGESSDSGRGTLVWTKGVPYVEQQITTVHKTKAECWDTLGFVNYIKGRGKSFWVRSELDFLEIVSTVGAESVTVVSLYGAEGFGYLRYLWVEDSTGAFDIVGIAEIVGNIIYLETTSLSDISRIWQAHAVRMADDVFEEEYLTDSVMLATFTVQELQGI